MATIDRYGRLHGNDGRYWDMPASGVQGFSLVPPPEQLVDETPTFDDDGYQLPIGWSPHDPEYSEPELYEEPTPSLPTPELMEREFAELEARATQAERDLVLNHDNPLAQAIVESMPTQGSFPNESRMKHIYEQSAPHLKKLDTVSLEVGVNRLLHNPYSWSNAPHEARQYMVAAHMFQMELDARNNPVKSGLIRSLFRKR